MEKTREQILAEVAEHWPDLVKECLHCTQQRKQLAALAKTLGVCSELGPCHAPGIEDIKVECNRCNSLGFKMTDKGQALALLFGIGVPAEEEEPEVPY